MEVVELETAIGQQEYNVPGSKREDDEGIARNKWMLDKILERPSLSELLQRSVEKHDQEAARKAEAKLDLMQRFSLRNLAARVNSVVGMNANRSSSVALSRDYAPGARADGNTTWLASSIGDARHSPVTDPNFDSSPSRRALHAYAQLVNANLQDKTKYIPYREHMPQSRLHKHEEDDSYRYKNIEAILASASSHFKFSQDIDNSEEEELTDDELKERIKKRKNKERDRRDDLTMVRAAAIDTARTVEAARKKIQNRSIIKGAINLEALKERQAKLRDKIDMSDAMGDATANTARKLNERSGDLG